MFTKHFLILLFILEQKKENWINISHDDSWLKSTLKLSHVLLHRAVLNVLY